MTLRVKEDISHLLNLADGLQHEANQHNIIHVFDDGGYRELLLVKMFGLTRIAGRHGDDGRDEETGLQYELKTVNLMDTSGNIRRNPGITTCHHVNHEIIRRYRAVAGFLVGVFFINHPARIYEVPTHNLEPHFQKWEDRLNTEPDLKHINNPKIPFKYISKNGVLLYRNPDFDKFIK